MSEEHVGVPVLERAPDGADGPLDALFFVVIALFLGKHRYGGSPLQYRCHLVHVNNARRCVHQTYVGLDQSTVHSVVVGEFHLLTSSCVAKQDMEKMHSVNAGLGSVVGDWQRNIHQALEICWSWHCILGGTGLSDIWHSTTVHTAQAHIRHTAF